MSIFVFVILIYFIILIAEIKTLKNILRCVQQINRQYIIYLILQTKNFPAVLPYN